MTLKHRNTSKWAKRIIQRGLAARQSAKTDGTRDALAEQMRTHAQLTRKIHSATIGRPGDDEDEDEEGEEEEGEEERGGERGSEEEGLLRVV